MWHKIGGSVWLRLSSFSLMLLLLVACSTSTQAPALSVTIGPSPASSPILSPPSQLGAPACHPPSPLDVSNTGYQEALGTTGGTTLWVLFEGGIPSARSDAKLIWRLGPRFQEPLRFVGLGPQGQNQLPLFVSAHEGSNWNRPGDEWGTGFHFPVAGCWDMRVTGRKDVGDVWIVIS